MVNRISRHWTAYQRLRAVAQTPITRYIYRGRVFEWSPHDGQLLSRLRGYGPMV